MATNECEQACQRVSLRLDSELSEFEEVLLAAHLERCARCRAFEDDLVGLTAMVRAARLEEPGFVFQLPGRRSRAFALREVLAVASVAVFALSGLVGLRLSLNHATGKDARAASELMDFKERQLRQLDGYDRSRSRKVPPGLAAAEQTTAGSPAHVNRAADTAADATSSFPDSRSSHEGGRER